MSGCILSCCVLQLDGRRAPVDDLLVASSHSASAQPLDGDSAPSDVISIPSVEPDVKGGMSGSPPAILDDWLELQRAVTLRSLDNGSTLNDAS